MRRAGLLLIAVLLAGLGAIGFTGPVRAECPWFPIPPATDAARSAREIMVGTVIENRVDQVFDFSLRVDRVLRGAAKVGEVRRFEWVYPGWPFIENEGALVLNDEGKPVPPCEPIPGWKGNVIAFSLDALAPDGETRYNAASWISGDLPISRDLPRTTLAEMIRLAGLPQTDMASLPGSAADGGSLPVAALIAIGAVALLAAAGVDLHRRRFEGQ